MKLSTKGRYGLRAVIDIAIYGEKEAVPLGVTAQRQNISVSYLEQLAAKLKKGGIITSIRGAQGGYQLAKSAALISVGDILRVLEGDLNPVDCAAVTGEGISCEALDFCVTKYVWKRISDSINETVDHLMLSELVEEAHFMQNKGKDENGSVRTDCDARFQRTGE